mmetsp:Transcript_12873/g.17592  ORF Transcript_12873/g.17592 Transcript_12873/m.17592 type:complete len:353 (-) Transcript_12873:228-1286(-)|eukprot:CAMPEP_0196586812 /NCGR_PEP_ID=MMETSP1081-20130531/55626_1 /TAXON_ID=36882 /ORGANISM="Pyramimonas amylifera, Strain CCMP720" /LENGTH=352 /DNA_ID=CAMNT_0041908813 /DNA_START=61 /DNA_END=1119 /DNA_ORIENTATION=-
MAYTAAEARKLTLIDLLLEDNEDIEEPPEYACKLWNEDQIRQYFSNDGLLTGLPKPHGTVLDSAKLLENYPPVSEELFTKWFPGLQRTKTKVDNPRMRLICFTNAGNEENVYSVEGVGARKVSTLLDWCRANNVEMLAVQLPGRGARKEERCLNSTSEVAEAVLQVLGSKIVKVPYCVIGHSVGTWCAFEMLSLAREKGFPMPLKVFFSCFPSPDIPEDRRPWKRSRLMRDQEFMAEARMWDVNEVVFQEDMWKLYSPLMRADFRLFDEYEFSREGELPFEFPITTFVGRQDKKVKKPMVAGWQKFTIAPFEVHDINGNHLYLMGLNEQKPAKIQWYEIIVKQLTTFVKNKY